MVYNYHLHSIKANGKERDEKKWEGNIDVHLVDLDL